MLKIEGIYMGWCWCWFLKFLVLRDDVMVCVNKLRYWWVLYVDLVVWFLKLVVFGKGGVWCWVVGIGFIVFDFNVGFVFGYMWSEYSVKFVNV